jgi:methoxymalonate biosynthesis protein
MSAIKCVVWDLDDTVWPGVAVESDGIPEPHERVLALLDAPETIGIVSSVASRGDPALASGLAGHPRLGGRFVAPRVAWDEKSESIERIAAALRIDVDAVAFVDEDPFERAGVAHALPAVLVLSVAELEAALAGGRLTPERLTDEGRRRTAMYREEQRRRQVATGFAGDRTDFLRWCDMRLDVGVAEGADLDRLVELGERTHRLNSAARRAGRADVLRWFGAGGLVRARLADRFGDYGLVGMVAMDRPAGPDWRVDLLAVSCRVEGRGVPAALLRWTMGEARRAGAPGLRALYRANGRNVRLAVLLRQLGFRRAAGADDAAEFRRSLDGELPPYPEWLRICG